MSRSINSRFTRLLLEVEVSENQFDEFSKKYLSATGKDPRASEHCQLQPDKWGLEARLYFDGDEILLTNLQKLGFHVEERTSGYRSDYPYRVNSNRLFWRAVEHGYRLGENTTIP